MKDFRLEKENFEILIIDCSVVEKFDVPRVTSIPDRDNFFDYFFTSPSCPYRFCLKN